MKVKLNIVLVLFSLCQYGLWAVPQEDDLYMASIELKQGEIITRKLKADEPGTMGGQVAGIIEAPIHKVWEVLSDYNHFHEYMPRMPVTYIVTKAALDEIGTREVWKRKAFEKMLISYRIESMESDTVYFYNVVDMPLPVRDRWYLLEMVRDPFCFHVEWKMVTGNMIVNSGSWQLMLHPECPNRTVAVYTTISNSGIPIPGFIQKYGLGRSLPNIIKGVRKRAGELIMMAADTTRYAENTEGGE
jgi:hypothetical protein